MRIHTAARKHGISDEDILHALVYARCRRGFDRDGSLRRTLVFGPSRSGNILEVVVLHTEAGDDIVIHAMPLRRTYRDRHDG